MSTNRSTLLTLIDQLIEIGRIASRTPGQAETWAEYNYVSGKAVRGVIPPTKYRKSYYHGITTLLRNPDPEVRRGAVVIIALTANNDYSHGYFEQQPDERERMMFGLLESADYRKEDTMIFREYAIRVAIFLISIGFLDNKFASRFGEKLRVIASGQVGQGVRADMAALVRLVQSKVEMAA